VSNATVWIRPLNEIEAGNNLITVMAEGSLEKASDYYNRFCLGFKWTPMLGFRIREACKKQGWDPRSFGAQEGSGKIREVRRGHWTDMTG
jgi:hypothetical protein